MADKTYEIPDDCRYSRTDEWIRIDGTTGRTGVTDYAQSELSDIVFVELPEAGKTVAQGDVLGTIESVKAVSEIFSPVSGTVVEPNGTPVNNAEVRLEDRGWNPSVTTMGAGQTNAQGRYDFEVPELIDVEDCWGVLLNYYIVAERGPAFGEDDVNPSLLAAINDQSLVANLPQLVITAP